MTVCWKANCPRFPHRHLSNACCVSHAVSRSVSLVLHTVFFSSCRCIPLSYSIMSSNPGINGTLPEEWGVLHHLIHISVHSCALQGQLPIEWFSLSSLEEIYLFQNHLSGHLPSEWSSLTNLRVIELWENSISGSLPESWGNMTSIWSVILSVNPISGPIPSSWSSMSQLTHLSLHSMSLSGSLPESFALLENLEVVLSFILAQCISVFGLSWFLFFPDQLVYTVTCLQTASKDNYQPFGVVEAA